MSQLFTITGKDYYEIVFLSKDEPIDLLFTGNKVIRAKHIYNEAKEQLNTYGDKACAEVLRTATTNVKRF